MFKSIKQLFCFVSAPPTPDPIPSFEEWLEVNDSVESQCWEDAVSEFAACGLELTPEELNKDVMTRCSNIYRGWVRANFEMG